MSLNITRRCLMPYSQSGAIGLLKVRCVGNMLFRSISCYVFQLHGVQWFFQESHSGPCTLSLCSWCRCSFSRDMSCLANWPTSKTPSTDPWNPWPHLEETPARTVLELMLGWHLKNLSGCVRWVFSQGSDWKELIPPTNTYTVEHISLSCARKSPQTLQSV